MIEFVVFTVSLLTAVLAIALLRERRLRLALAVLLRRLLEHWRRQDANDLDGGVHRDRRRL